MFKLVSEKENKTKVTKNSVIRYENFPGIKDT